MIFGREEIFLLRVFALKEETEDLDKIILVRGFIEAYRNYILGRDQLAR